MLLASLLVLPSHAAGLPSAPSLRIDLAGTGPGVAPSADGEAVVLPRGGSATTFALHLSLPPLAPDAPPWILRFNRVELKSLKLDAPGWRPQAQDFFHPAVADGKFPVAFEQRLPRQWSGNVDVRVTAATDLVRTLRPQLLTATQCAEQDKQDLMIVAALQASLLVLVAVVLTLLLGTREFRLLNHLALLAATSFTVWIASGHAYSGQWRWPWLAGLGANGLNLAMFLLCASGALVMRDHVGNVVEAVWYRKCAAWLAGVFLLGAALCTIGLPGDSLWVTMAWIVTEALAIVGFLGVSLRSAWLGLPPLVAMLPLGFASVMSELSVRGGAGEFWRCYGFLIGLVLMCLLLVVGMLGRVSDSRLRHEKEKQAREASETELERQLALSGLGQELRRHLPLVESREMHAVAARIALARLVPLLRLKSASAVLYRRGKDDARAIEPAHYEERIRLLMEANAARLRSLVQWQSPVANLEMVGPSRTLLPGVVFGGVPIAIERGDRGVVLIEREGEQPFDPDELTVAIDFCELALECIAEAKAAQKLRRDAELDALTETLNRSAIDEQLARAFDRAYLHQDSLGVLFVDLDRFKTINDSFGHACGDHCLKALADILRGALRSGDLLGRYGGEEFLVLLPGCDGAHALELGERLRRAVEDARLHWQGHEIRLTISIGVSARAPHEGTPTAAMARADGALYAAKDAGRNRVQLAS